MHDYIWVQEGVSSDVFFLGHEGVSGLSTSYSPHQADPYRDDQSPIHSPVYSKGEKKKDCTKYLTIYSFRQL